jgi:hypothetical protein
MSVGPRIVFTRFASGASPSLRPWQEHLRRVAGALPDTAGTADGESSVIVWNLMSANNRDLGHGAQIYPRLEEAVIDARMAIVEHSRLEVRLVRGDRHHVFGWELSVDGKVVMVCPRWYQTDRERRHSIGLVMVALPVASVSDGAQLARSSAMAGDRSHPSR